jgi:hypothetical protein
MFKRILRFSLFLVGLYVLTIAAVYIFQKNIIFRPDKLKTDHVFRFDAPCEEHFFTTPDGEQINGLFFSTHQSSKKGIILYFHGNSDNLQRWAGYHNDFTSRGYDFLAIDYRGYGKSTGKVGEQNMYKDAKMVYDWVADQYEEDEIILYGRSLGTGVASNVASTNPAKMLILETPYNNIRTAIKKNAPFLWLPFKFNYKFPNDEHLKEVEYPVHIFQGTKDRIVPYASASLLKPLLKEESNFVTIKDGKHKNLRSFKKYQKRLDKILGERIMEKE